MPIITKDTSSKKTYYVRDGLVVKLTEEKTYISGEPVEMTDAEYGRHAHQVETEEQYKARTAPKKTTSKTEDK